MNNYETLTEEEKNKMSMKRIASGGSVSVLSDFNEDKDLNQAVVRMYRDAIAKEQEIIQEMRDVLLSNPDPEVASSLAQLEKSVGDKMKMLAELSMQKERIASTERINNKKIEASQNKTLPSVGATPGGGLIATREEIMQELIKALPELKEKILGCWCAPHACHGDVLAKLANS